MVAWAFIRGDERGEDVDGGGLAGAVRAEESEDGALFDCQVDAVDRGYGAGALGQGFGDYCVRHDAERAGGG
jgi:hypothetical protein